MDLQNNRSGATKAPVLQCSLLMHQVLSTPPPPPTPLYHGGDMSFVVRPRDIISTITPVL